MRIPPNLTVIEEEYTTWPNPDDPKIDDIVPNLDVIVIPGYYSDEKDLSFTWNITRYIRDELWLQLWFTDPLQISYEADPEKLKIIFYGEELFQDINYGLSVNGGPNPQEDEVLYKNIPE